MPRTLITGATGFIGCRLAELWHGEGRDLLVAGLPRPGVEKRRAHALQEAGLPLLAADLSAEGAFDELLAETDTVVHLAAAQHEANVDAARFERVNSEATGRLLERCERWGVKRFFYASSVGVYGVNDSPGIDEETALAPDNPYGQSKATAEALLRRHDGDLEIFIGRIGEAYGPWDMRLHKLYKGIASGRFWLVGSGGNLHQPIYVDDLARAIDRLLSTPEAAGRPVILCGDRPVTTREMCKSIAAALGKDLNRLRIPMWPVMLAAVSMEATLGKVGIQPPLHRRRLDFFRKSLSFSTALRDRLLSLPAQLSFPEGARKTAEWYREKGWL